MKLSKLNANPQKMALVMVHCPGHRLAGTDRIAVAPEQSGRGNVATGTFVNVPQIITKQYKNYKNLVQGRNKNYVSKCNARTLQWKIASWSVVCPV